MTCVEHSVALVTRCAVCGEDADSLDPAIDTCRCGAELWLAGAENADSRTDALLIAMIAGGADHPYFAGAGLSQVDSHLLRLGLMSAGWRSERPSANGLSAIAARDAGLAVASGGREALHEVLDGIVADAPTGASGRTGLTLGYGWVWPTWLGVPTPNPLDVRLCEEVRRHAVGAGLAIARTVGGVTLKEACGILNAGHLRGRRLALNTGLIATDPLPGVPMSIEREAVERLAGRLAIAVDATRAAAIVGLGRMRFRELVRSGLIASDEELGAMGAGTLFDPGGLDDLIGRVCRGVPVVDAVPTACLPLSDACRIASVPVVRVVRAVLEGQLVPVARTRSPGLGAMCFSLREMRQLLRTRPPSVRGAAASLGLHYEAARWLAAGGHLGAKPGVVDAAGVALFAECHLTTRQMAAITGIDGRTASARLRAGSVKPRFGPPECRQAIWDRSSALLLLAPAGRA